MVVRLDPIYRKASLLQKKSKIYKKKTYQEVNEAVKCREPMNLKGWVQITWQTKLDCNTIFKQVLQSYIFEKEFLGTYSTLKSSELIK